VLSGLGGDEVFWGYSHYGRVAEDSTWRRLLEGIPDFARSALIGAAVGYGRLRGQEKWERLACLRSGLTPEALYYGLRGFFSLPEMARLLGMGGAEAERIMEQSLERIRPPCRTGYIDPSSLNYIEVHRYLHDQLLRDVDVFSMAHSIEVRVPYLDHELMECAAALSDNQKLDHAMNKPALVRTTADEAVTAAASRRKMGFTFPMDKWMKEQSGQLGEIARSAPGLDRRETATLWRAFEHGRLHWSRAWALVVLGSQKSAVSSC
jgi:asparagine synthase (glutamine-hydrolysing)